MEVTAVDGASISLAWVPGFNGGYNQSFDIQVFDETTGQRVLKLRNIRRVEGNRTVIHGLTPQTRYAMKIRAWNRDGYSNFSEEVIIKTRRKYLLLSVGPGIFDKIFGYLAWPFHDLFVRI